jgi:hypothetical protein
MGMGASLYRAIGAIIGVGTGLSILALEAVRVRRAFNLMALSRLREILDVENVSRDPGLLSFPCYEGEIACAVKVHGIAMKCDGDVVNTSGTQTIQRH